MDTSATHNGASTSISNSKNTHNNSGISNFTMKNTPVKTMTAFGRKVSPASAPQSVFKKAQTTPLSGMKFAAAKSLSERHGKAFAPHSKKVKAQTTEENEIHGFKGVPKRREACEEMTVFVSNVPCEATEEDLRNQFMKCGEVVNVTMLQPFSPCLPRRFSVTLILRTII
ncbi:uncharacterized protein LOC131029075 [Cryptomeria japonica]|uniref:uncharacterized protein LOC131029075 n=1 Tax=Cryptomeria japonica TaxID=3369 RepID=UPI0027D9E152|nr:uncharacterized protein LOC131029075 [Cryptomeria japonica]